MKRLVMLAILVMLFSVIISSASHAGEWYERIKLGGDFRDRYDGIQDETKDYDRHRNRIRARLSVTAAISEEFTFVSRLATGINDPASTNRTLTDAFTTKEFWLDLAYFDYKPLKAEELHLYGGKMKNSYYKLSRNQLVWDNDVTPEGLAVGFERNASDKVSYFLNGSWYSVMEGKAAPDIYMLGAQGGLKIRTSEKTHILFGGSYYGYENIKGASAWFGDVFFGNSSMDEGGELVYANDYRIAEGFGEFGFKTGGTSWTAFGSYVNNTAADSLNTGWIAGLGVRNGKGKGAWKLGGFYKWVEADAVVGLFADSDFAGGVTNAKGFAIMGGYAIADRVELGTSLFINQLGIEEEEGFNRLFIDLILKF